MSGRLDETRQFGRIGIGGVNWAICSHAYVRCKVERNKRR